MNNSSAVSAAEADLIDRIIETTGDLRRSLRSYRRAITALLAKPGSRHLAAGATAALDILGDDLELLHRLNGELARVPDLSQDGARWRDVAEARLRQLDDDAARFRAELESLETAA